MPKKFVIIIIIYWYKLAKMTQTNNKTIDEQIKTLKKQLNLLEKQKKKDNKVKSETKKDKKTNE